MRLQAVTVQDDSKAIAPHQQDRALGKIFATLRPGPAKLWFELSQASAFAQRRQGAALSDPRKSWRTRALREHGG